MDIGIVIGLITGYALGFYLIVKCIISLEQIFDDGFEFIITR